MEVNLVQSAIRDQVIMELKEQDQEDGDDLKFPDLEVREQNYVEPYSMISD